MTSPLAVWSTEHWRLEATGWLDARLADNGAARTGPVEQPHVRPWATALTAPTTIGRVWLKAMAQGTAFEARLYALLETLIPGHILRPIAVDLDRAWLLLPDGGIPVRERLDGPQRTKATLAALTQYAEIQRRLAPHVEKLIGCGVTDMRPAVMLDRFDEALAWVGDRINPAVPPMRPEIEEWCQRLADAPGEPSLDHNDLHGWNLLGDADEIRFYDWGDAVVSHPFASLLVPLEFADPDDRPMLRDAFLAVYADLGPHDELVAVAELACRLGQVARTLAFKRALGDTLDDRWAVSAEYLNTLAPS